MKDILEIRAPLPNENHPWQSSDPPALPISFKKDDFILPTHKTRLSSIANPHQRDKRIVFDEEPHLYYVDGLTTGGSVTGLVHAFEDQFDPDDAICKMRFKQWPREKYMKDDVNSYAEAVASALGSLLSTHQSPWCLSAQAAQDLSPESVDAIDNILSACTLSEGVVDKASVASILHRVKRDPLLRKELGSIAAQIEDHVAMTTEQIKSKWEADGNEAANEGTWMHLQIELWLNRDGCHSETVEMSTFFKYTSEWLLPMGVKCFRTEWEIFSEIENLAGSVDFVGIKENGHLMLADWKRTKELERGSVNTYGRFLHPPLDHIPDCKVNKYKLQLNLYKYIIEKYYGHVVDEMHIACFHPDCEGTPYIVDVPVMEKEAAFLMAHQRHKYAKEILDRFASPLML